MLKQPYGPYRVIAGTHVEPFPVKDITAERMDGQTIHLNGGETMEAVTGNAVLYKGEQYALYVERERGGVRRISPGELRAVSKDNPVKVTLVESREYTKASEPFMAFRELDKVFANKFIRDYEGQQFASAEVDELKRKVAELERQLAAQSQGEVLPPDLENMTVQQLRDYAASEEILLNNAKTKTEIIDAIQAAQTQPA